MMATECTEQWWRLTWRVVLTRAWGFPRPDRDEVLEVATVAELRAVVLRARTDPTIENYRFWRAREWVGGDPSHGCAEFADGYAPARLSVRACRCGTDHRVYDCPRCGQSICMPPVGPGCGPIPVEPAPRQR